MFKLLFSSTRAYLAISFLALLFIPPLQAEVREYIRQYDYQAEPYDTGTSARIAAIDGLKLELQHELGTYIGVITNIEKDAHGIANFNQDTIQITAGIVSLKLLEEKWNGISYYVKGQMKVDVDEVKESIRALREDTELEDMLRESMHELTNLRTELTQLRNKLQLQNQVAYQQTAENYRKVLHNIEVEGVYQQAMSARLVGNYRQSFELLKNLAEKGDVNAQLRVGRLYQKGVGIEQDYAEALNWYRLAAIQNHRDAKALIGQMYEIGLGVEADPLKALSLYKQAADRNSGIAFVDLGKMYLKGILVAGDDDKALQYFYKAAANDNATGIAFVGLMFHTGRSVSRDFEKAREYYERAIGMGNAFAMGRLGLMYYKGHGVDKNIRKARALIFASAERGNGFGLAWLGKLFENGHGVDKNHERAFELYQQSANAGSPFGYFFLGHAYHKGIGVDKNIDKARFWLRKAADQGLPMAKVRLRKIGN